MHHGALRLAGDQTSSIDIPQDLSAGPNNSLCECWRQATTAFDENGIKLAKSVLAQSSAGPQQEAVVSAAATQQTVTAQRKEAAA
ncbi:MAG: hypothetical protein EOS71_06330 [Mesorhizobium sp.]|nr:hypothetical protein EOA35_16005 [Mesorhizobium sp. M8A.F.Ca.ET.023.01.1.1]RWC77275.1 MAG: hypothetical protein EOS71_06330 [Mesorhizobium sp.]